MKSSAIVLYIEELCMSAIHKQNLKLNLAIESNLTGTEYMNELKTLIYSLFFPFSLEEVIFSFQFIHFPTWKSENSNVEVGDARNFCCELKVTNCFVVSWSVWYAMLFWQKWIQFMHSKEPQMCTDFATLLWFWACCKADTCTHGTFDNEYEQ